ncbi:zf-HC2 domain-containing protein, partial [bacterium]|nr:zf-HC2 domain-containing protein [bacterium]
MNCNQVQDNLSSFLDNELNGDQTNAIKAHLIRCQKCRQSRDNIENMGNMIRQINPTTASPDFQFRVYSAIRQKESKRQSNSFFKWQTILVPVAAMILGIFIGLNSNSIYPGSPGNQTLTAENSTQITNETMTAKMNLIHNLQATDKKEIHRYSLDSYVRRPLIPINV